MVDHEHHAAGEKKRIPSSERLAQEFYVKKDKFGSIFVKLIQNRCSRKDHYIYYYNNNNFI